MCAIGTMKGRYRNKKTGETGVGVLPIACGKWQCEECRTVKARAIMARSMNGLIAQAAQEAGFREQYNFKTLALTYGGREMRERYTREEAAIQMRDAFRKLILFLRKHLGWFDYIRVTEDQKDGYPHYHVILAGPNIAPKWVLQMIEDAWRGEYGMGFVKLHKIYTVEKAIKYVLKYLFKEPAIYEGLRIFSSSKGSLLKKTPSQNEWTNIAHEWGNYKGCKFAGVLVNGKFIRSKDGRKVLLRGRDYEGRVQLEACFESDGPFGLKWLDFAPEGTQQCVVIRDTDECPF